MHDLSHPAGTNRLTCADHGWTIFASGVGNLHALIKMARECDRLGHEVAVSVLLESDLGNDSPKVAEFNIYATVWG